MKSIFKILVLIFFSYTFQTCVAQNPATSFSAADFKAAVEADPEAVVIDVRTPQEYSEGYLFNAHNIDYENDNFEKRIAGMDRNKTYYVYCLGGSRSTAAIKIMQKEGFNNLRELKGGMMAWRKAGLPVAGNNSKQDKITYDQYSEMISDGYVLVDFYAPWCMPCKKLEPILKSIADTYQGKLKVVRVNIDENVKLAVQLSADEIPVLRLYQNGKEVWEERGFVPEETITAAIDKFQKK